MNNSSNNLLGKSLDKKVLSIVHLLHPYVKQRIRVAENFGIFPKNMYQSNGVIDDVILKVYENGTRQSIDVNELRIIMFELANNKLKSLFENEKWHKNSISTKFILEEELKQLEEDFTVDAGNDLIMNEELDDISYHQNDDESPLLLSEENQQNIINFLDLKDKSFFYDRNNQNVLHKMYRMLPLQTSNVVDLYVLGKLNLHEIANILSTEIIEVKRIINFVKINFKKYLN